MKSLINQDFKHLLWKDEIGDNFILLKYGGVYRYSENTLRLLAWSRKIRIQLRRKGVVLNETSYDDGLYSLDIDRSNLSLLIELGTFKRRPHKNGKWIKTKERLLGHRIFPFNPTLEDGLDVPERPVTHSRQKRKLNL